MDKQPLVSIIIPIHNAQAFLDECLRSVTNQTYRNLEIIAVNDDSKDDSVSVIREWQAKDKRIQYHSTSKHNAALTRDVGVQNANGEYVCFLDSDDIIHEEYVDILYKAIISTDSEVVTAKIAAFHSEGDIDQLDKGTGLQTVTHDPVAYFFDHYLWDSKGDHIAQSINAKMFKRELLMGVDYSVLKTSILEDNYIVPQIFKKMNTQQITLIDRTLYYYRQNLDSTMSNALSNTISYEGKEISYSQFFDITMTYIKNLYSDYEGIDYFIYKIKSQVYYDLTLAMVGMIAQIKELSSVADQKAKLDADIKILGLKIDDIQSSKSYRIGRLITSPVRVARKLIKLMH